jgi:hypothetical protein
MAEVKRSFSMISGIQRNMTDKIYTNQENISKVYNMVNIEPSSIAGELQKSPGFKLVIDTGSLSPINNIFFSVDNNQQQRMTITSNSSLYDIQNWNNLSSVSKLIIPNTIQGNMFLVSITDKNLGKVIVIINGIDPPYVYDYSSISNLNNNLSFISSFGFYSNDRLWLNDINEQSVIHWSTALDCTDFTTVDNAGLLQMGDGKTKITAIGRMFVPKDNSTNLIVSKANEIWGISGDTGDSTDANRFKQFPISENVIGTTNNHGLISIDQQLMVIGANDISLLGKTIYGNIVKESFFDELRDFYRTEINISNVDNFIPIINNKDGYYSRVYILCSSLNTTYNNKALVFDAINGWFIRDFGTFRFCSIAVDPDTNKIYLGSSDGKIYVIENDYYLYDQTSYESLLETGFINFSYDQDGKQLTENSQIDINVTTISDFNFKFKKKYRNGFIKTTQKNTKIHPAYIPPSQINPYYEDNIDQRYLSNNIKINSPGLFNELSLEISNSEKYNFKIKNILLESKVPIIR